MRPSTRQIRRKNLLSWVGLLLLFCAALTFPIYQDFLAHDFDLYRKVNVFRRIKHPAGTTRVAFKKFLGLYMGNGNHCDSFIGELRRYTGDQQAIDSFYASNLVTDGQGAGILFVENGEFPDVSMYQILPYRLDRLSAWLDAPDAPRDHLYLIYFYDIIALDPGWDLRCT